MRVMKLYMECFPCLAELTCEVMEIGKCSSTLRCYDQLERMDEGEMTRKIYKTGMGAVGVRWPSVKWEHRVLEYMRE